MMPPGDTWKLTVNEVSLLESEDQDQDQTAQRPSVVEMEEALDCVVLVVKLQNQWSASGG